MHWLAVCFSFSTGFKVKDAAYAFPYLEISPWCGQGILTISMAEKAFE